MNEKLENMSAEVSLDLLKALVADMLDALVAVSAERDEAVSRRNRAYRQRDDERAAKEGNLRALNTALADRDRLHKAITEALGELGDPESKGPWLSGNIPNAVRRILRAALDKEGKRR